MSDLCKAIQEGDTETELSILSPHPYCFLAHCHISLDFPKIPHRVLIYNRFWWRFAVSKETILQYYITMKTSKIQYYISNFTKSFSHTHVWNQFLADSFLQVPHRLLLRLFLPPLSPCPFPFSVPLAFSSPSISSIFFSSSPSASFSFFLSVA